MPAHEDDLMDDTFALPQPMSRPLMGAETMARSRPNSPPPRELVFVWLICHSGGGSKGMHPPI